jgi:cell division septation protein DedD
MKIEHHITNLLYRHDCVIIPGLGGFIANYAPATIHPTRHIFTPPSKSVLFNPHLQQNDGLLASHMASCENIAYEKALAGIEDFVLECRERIYKDQPVVFDNLGIITAGKEGSLCFEPDTKVNYLEESFALPVFMFPPLRNSRREKRLQKKFTDRKASVHAGRRKVSTALILSSATVVLAVLLVIFLNPFGLLPERAHQTSIVPVKEDFRIPENIGSTSPAPPDQASRHQQEAEPPAGKDQAEHNEEATGENMEAAGTTGPVWCVIGGAFRYKENADKLVGTLRDKGYQARLAGITAAGLHMVSYYEDSDEAQARQHLAAVKNEENPSAWLYKRP